MFASLLLKLNPYMLWIKLAAIALCALFVFNKGYEVGEWKQKSADQDVVTAAQNVVSKINKSIADAQAAGRKQAEEAYKDEIAHLTAANQLATSALAQYQEENKRLATKNAEFDQTIRDLRHDKANAAFLDQPIPAAIRNRVQGASQAGH